MRVNLLVVASLMALAACSGPKDTPLPKDLEKMESIKPAMEKLTPEERELAAGYIMRHTIGAKLGGLFGGKEVPGIPEGMTLGKAIEEQRKFKADAALVEAKQQALKAKLQAEREAAMKPMLDAVTVTLVSKKDRHRARLQRDGYGRESGSFLRVQEQHRQRYFRGQGKSLCKGYFW
ncbi:hypothetical protein [Acidovorax soli]|uniref:hypothetical protein n=1 Tax=Acidovorax TaxID=12916 RepID=UPI0026EAD734|nr:hypothetical protein [Acidovorax soli]MCM2348156.1 hypothetical protein [Acidovorax soli]